MIVSSKSHQRKKQEECGLRDGGKIERKLSEFNTKAVFRGQNEPRGKFNMAVGDVISLFLLLFLCFPHFGTFMIPYSYRNK